MDNNIAIQMTWYFRGARQRLEQMQESAPNIRSVVLTQCDQKAYFILDEQSKTYLKRPVDEGQNDAQRTVQHRSSETVDVVITTDIVDTGERRAEGKYQARRVKTTVTTKANNEAGVPGSKMETDGWYIDLPGWNNCREDSGDQPGMIMASVGRRFPHYVFRKLGTARRGFPIEETTTSTQGGKVSVSKTEFLGISDARLDPSLFELPAGYSLTTHLPMRRIVR